MHHDRLLYLHLPVFEAAFQQFFGKESVFSLRLLDGESDFRFRPRAFNDVQPFLLGRLVGIGQHGNRVAALQLLPDGNVLAVDVATHAGAADF